MKKVLVYKLVAVFSWVLSFFDTSLERIWVERGIIEGERQIKERLKMGENVVVLGKKRKNKLIRQNHALKQKIITTFSPKIRGEVFGRAKWHCEYCGAKSKNLTVDHVKAIVNGGTSDISNLAACCLSCNRRKGDKDVEKFLEELQMTTNI